MDQPELRFDLEPDCGQKPDGKKTAGEKSAGEVSGRGAGTPRAGGRAAGRSASGEAQASAVARGVCRILDALGYRTLHELPLGNGRRVDVIGLNRRGAIAIVEIKVSVADLRADDKWPEYVGYCDHFYFAVPADFPRHEVPRSGGLIVADRFGGTVIRRAPQEILAAARRRALTLRFARAAAARLARTEEGNGAP